MRKSRFTTEQIMGSIKQAEAGMAVWELGHEWTQLAIAMATR